MTNLALAAAIAGYVCAFVPIVVFLRRLGASIKAEKDGLQCLLRSRIREIYYKHCDEERATIREYERQDLDDLYAGYKVLGGNHFVDDLYEKMRNWKVVT